VINIAFNKERNLTMTSRSVKGLLAAVVVLLALNLVAQWGMGQAPGARTDRGGVVGMVVDEWRSQYVTLYRVYRDGTVEGTRVSKDKVIDRLEEGVWSPIAAPTAVEKGKGEAPAPSGR
jgi:hypothetical protein